jgi:hypothetical protein
MLFRLVTFIRDKYAELHVLAGGPPHAVVAVVFSLVAGLGVGAGHAGLAAAGLTFGFVTFVIGAVIEKL